MPTKIQITRGLQFHSQEQCYEVDIPDGNKTTIADLRGILITQKVMTENDLFILPNSNLNLESSLDSPSSSSDTSVQPAVLVKLDENRNDWSRLQKVDESIAVLEAPGHLQIKTEPLMTGRVRGNGSILGRLINVGAQAAQAVQAGGQLMPSSSLISQNSQISQTSQSVQPTEDLFQVANMNDEQWDRVFHINQVFNGIRMGVKSENDDHGPERSAFPLIEPHADVIPNRIAANGIDTAQNTVCSERNHKYLRAGWTNAAIDVTTPYASASVEARYTESHSQEVVDKTTYTTNIRMYQQVRLEFDLKAVKANLSNQFKSDLEEALNQGDDAKRRTALLALFEHYGHVFATRITLGGSIISSDIQTVHNHQQNNSKKSELMGSVKAPFLGGKVGGGSEKENSSSDHNDNAMQSTKILGGHQTYAPKRADEEPSEKWVNSIQTNYQFWQIIRTDGVVPITYLLPDEYRDRVIRLSPVIKPLWGYLADVEHIGKHGVDFYKPMIPKKNGPWYFLGYSLDNSRALVVKERFTGSLCEIQGVKDVWNDKSFTAEHFVNLTPSTPGYIAMASLHYSGPRFKNTQSMSPLYTRIRAIKSDLLQPIDYDDEPVHIQKSLISSKRGSIWRSSHTLDGLSFDLMHASDTSGRPKKAAFTINPAKIEMIGVVDQTPAFEKNLALPLVPISVHAPTVSDGASATAASGTSAAHSNFTTPHMTPLSPLTSLAHESTIVDSAHVARPPSPTDTASVHTHVNVQASPTSGLPNLSGSGTGSAPRTPIQTVPPSLLFQPDRPTS